MLYDEFSKMLMVLESNIKAIRPCTDSLTYGKCSKISNTLKLRTPKIIAENNF